MSHSDAVDRSSIFIRGLGSRCSGKDLESHFSGVGPIRNSFVVTEKDSSCKGYGFVQFTNEDDATRALSVLQGSLLGNRKIRIEHARRRLREGGRSSSNANCPAPSSYGSAECAGNGSANLLPNDVAARALDEDGGLAKPQRLEPLKRTKGKATPSGSLSVRTVIVKPSKERTSLSEEDVRTVLKDESECNPSACVFGANGTELRCIFSSWPTAGKAASILHERGYPSCVEAYRGGKKCRVIIRNLPFRLSEKELRQVFQVPGKIRALEIPLSTVAVPKRSVGDKMELEDTAKKSLSVDDELASCPGFAFVEYFLAAHAKAAISKLNGTKIGGRVVAVDLAVKKELFETISGHAETETAVSVAEDSSRHGDCDRQKVVGDAAQSKAGKNEELRRLGEESSRCLRLTSRCPAPAQDGISSGERDDTSGVGKANLDIMTVKSPKGAAEIDTHGSSVDKSSRNMDELKRTVFVRNLPFETSAEELKVAMAKYGLVQRALLVIDPVRGRPRGTAFVLYKDETDANAAIEKNSCTSASSTLLGMNKSDIAIGGRPLLLSRAVDRSRAQELAHEKKVEGGDKEDPRNLRLAWVGHVQPGTEEARGLSQHDLDKRAKSEKNKRAKLSHNPNAFVSDVRLSVRNIPRGFDEKVLKQIFSKAASEKSSSKSRIASNPKITHCKIVRDESRNGRSKGYGFVQFEKHEDALRALTKVNNNPEALSLLLEHDTKRHVPDNERARILRKEWGDSRRLLVEFAVEDMRQVKILDAIKARGRERKQHARVSADSSAAVEQGNKSQLSEKTDKASIPQSKKSRKRPLQSNERDSAKPGRVEDTQDVVERSKDTSRVQSSASKRRRTADVSNNAVPAGSVKREGEEPTPVKTVQSKRRRADLNTQDKFDILVERYKQRVFDSANSQVSRWFDNTVANERS